MAWHKGTWWPLYVKEWYAPKSSQHMFDPYSFCLLVLGLLFHLLWGTDNIDNWIFGFLLAIGLELVWEIIGNSQFVLKRIRKNSGTSGEYIGRLDHLFEVSLTWAFLGDSIQNILGDVVSCALGYIVGTVFLAVELWWLSLVWIVISEVFHHQNYQICNLSSLGRLHLVHEGQPPDDHPHPAGPLRQTDDLAVQQDPQV